MPGKVRPVSWRPLPAEVVSQGFVDLGAAVSPSREVVAYALAVVEAPREERVQLWLGASGASKVFVNGTAVLTDRGRVACDAVVVAAGAWSKEVAALAGVALPNRPTRHEIHVTEPLKPWLGPLVSLLGSGLYFSQSLRGEVVRDVSVRITSDNPTSKITLKAR
jgi:glycine/D-amino acid oxidase-like deaminating enzyme